LNQKELAIQFLLGLDKTIFSVKVGQTLSEKYALPDTFQLTKEMIMNWYKGQVSARAIPTQKATQNSKSKTYDHEDSVSESINVASTENVTCIYCNKRGHGAQVCRKLIKWIQLKKNARNNNKSENDHANVLIYDDDEIGC
jgi:hypothetical protein